MPKIVFQSGKRRDALAASREAINELRRELGLSQEALARKIGVSLSTVSRWEQGLMAPRGAAIISLAELAPDDESLAKLGIPRRPNVRGKSGPEQWAHLAVEIIFQEAPEAVKAKLIDVLEEWAGKYGHPPSPMKPIPTMPAKKRRAK